MIDIVLAKSKVEQNSTENTENLIKFLQAIHGNNPFEIRILAKDNFKSTRSILRYGDSLYIDSSRNNKVKTTKYSAEAFDSLLTLEYLSSMGGEVFFTVNSPHYDAMDTCKVSDRHIKEIGSINAQFVDIDAPTEIKQNKIKLKQWKRSIKEKILAFTLSPSIVVETRNGYHVYWLLENGNTRLFRYIQMQLVQFFDGDKKCVNESRILRLPWFLHRKNPNDPFAVKLRKFSPSKRYTQEQLKVTLPDLEEETLEKVLRVNAETEVFESIEISSGRKKEIINLILNHTGQVKQYENKITLHCCMPDHPDHNPSAWIDSDFMWYHCSGCGSSESIQDLAGKLGWKDVLEEINKYDIDIDSELQLIKDHFVDVKDIKNLTLSEQEQEVVDSISEKVFVKLISFGQRINVKHKDYIYKIVQVLFKANKDKPYLISLDMGAGKSLIIDIFLQEILKVSSAFGAVVVAERREDVKRIAKQLNESTEKNTAYPLYGFDEYECLKNEVEGVKLNHCKGKSCPFKKECRFWNQSNEHQNYPVVVMTAQRLNLQADELRKYSFYYKDKNVEEKRTREMLIIDEKPKFSFIESLNKLEFEKFNKIILNSLKTYSFEGDLEFYYEYKEAIDKIKPFYNFYDKSREIFRPLNNKFKFSDSFWGIFASVFDYTQIAYQIPNIIESIIKYGGHIDAKNLENVTITTSHYNDYRRFKLFKTVIFDGTADIDTDYKLEEYQACKFEPIRTYEGLTIYTSSLISGSKTSMRNEDKLKAFCKDVKTVADENPKEKIFLPVFKDIKGIVTGYLKTYIEKGQILISHYGSTRGSNKFKDCSIVILGGILHKTENYYIGKSMSMSNQKYNTHEGTNCSKYANVRRFNDKNIEKVKLLDMLVDYSQEIKRSKQRDNSQNVVGKVFVFHNDKIFLDLLSKKFPACKVEEWIPQNIVEMSIFKKKNNKNVQSICEYLMANLNPGKDIPFDEVRYDLGLSKQSFSNTLKNQKLVAFLTSHHIEIYKSGVRKIFVQSS
ncbi:DEAD/DEAH box helicase family protein [Peribacillus sp. NPDC097197]|uniref:DEAD/DEAH box helicase family protein n=1 Tax=Peribacillus sp. NPDC097197 TaxID=3390615 RepID=UPI003CFD7654